MEKDILPGIRLQVILCLLSFFFNIGTTDVLAQSYWYKTNGPFTASIKEVSVLNDTTIFASTADKIYMSGNSGLSWTASDNGLPSDIKIHDIRSIWGAVFAATSRGLFKSIDEGESWMKVNTSKYEEDNINALAINGNGDIFIGLVGGTGYTSVYRSTNSGSTWNYISGNLMAAPTLYTSEAQDVYMGTDNYLHRSTDNGRTWKKISSNTMVGYFASIQARGNDLFVLRNVPGYSSNIYYTSDQGGSWKKLAFSTEEVTSIELDKDGVLYACTLNGLFYTSDNGGSWYQTSLGNTAVFSLENNSNGDYYAGTLRGFFRLVLDSGKWVQCNTGLNAGEIDCLAVNKNYIFAGSWWDGVFRSSDDGSSWEGVSNGLTDMEITDIIWDPDGYLFAGTASDGVFCSTDNGTTWMKRSAGLLNEEIECFTLDARGYLVAGTQRGVYYSKDKGILWEEKGAGLSDKWIISLGKNENGVLFAGYLDHGIYSMPRDGNSWSYDYLYNSRANVIKGHKAGVMYLGTKTTLMQSTDNGIHWNKIGPDEYINVSSLIVPDDGTVLAGTDKGFYRRSAGGAFSKMNSGFSNPNITSLAVNSKGYLLAGTRADGVYRSSLPAVSGGISERKESSLRFRLHQNYPNPFNPITTISYSIPRQSYVEIKVFDMLGREVSVLIRKYQNEGEYKVQFDGSILPSGAYIYKLSAGDLRDYKKLLLVK